MICRKLLSVGLLSAVLLAGIHPSGRAETPPATQPASPIQYTHEIRKDPPLHLHIAVVDLSDPRVEVSVVPAGPDPDGDGPWSTTLQTVRTVATRENFDLTINGSAFHGKDKKRVGNLDIVYFEGNWARPIGRFMTDGVLRATGKIPACLIVDDQGKVLVGDFPTLPDNARQVVSGFATIVANGKDVSRPDERAPRTAVGIDATGTKLIILVADGRRPGYSVGLSYSELAREMIRLGCVHAINLDGGGSSTFVMKDPKTHRQRVLNRPSDGNQINLPISFERPVANMIGIRIKPEE